MFIDDGSRGIPRVCGPRLPSQGKNSLSTGRPTLPRETAQDNLPIVPAQLCHPGVFMDFEALFVTKSSDGQTCISIGRAQSSQLPPGEVVIRVAYSSLNYKDALAARGHPGIVKKFPHVPGIDVAGAVEESGVYEFVPGDPVIVTGYELGAERWGGYAEFVRAPADWVLPLPKGLDFVDAMTLGTAGLTAGLCVDALLSHGISTEKGHIVVSGASGGVGSIAVAILGKLGFDVVAVTGKAHAHELLRKLGAGSVVGREAVLADPEKPLLSGRWAGGVDTVGGDMLSSILRATKHSGCVAACGLAGGAHLRMTVYPFILRGVTLAGIDAAWQPLAKKAAIWEKFAGPWRIEKLDRLRTMVPLKELPMWFDRILNGEVMGRIVVEVGGSRVPLKR